MWTKVHSMKLHYPKIYCFYLKMFHNLPVIYEAQLLLPHYATVLTQSNYTVSHFDALLLGTTA